MNRTTTVAAAPSPDASDRDLCFAASQGDQTAFRHIVERHQSMVCAAAYAGLGNLAQSEDVAQETFVIAWRKLTSLREPDQLRAWLCGIARTLAKNAQRRSARRGGEAVALTAIAEPDAPGLSPLETAIARDEAAMLNRALASVPESSREVLVLFYREEQSVAAVAERLGLSEAAVRQRLSRGRSLLRDEVTAMVEAALVKSRPTSAFTAAVLAAIAVSSPGAATMSAQGTMAAASAAAASHTASGLGVATMVGPMTGAATSWLAARLVRAGARSRDEAQMLGRFFAIGIGFAVGMVALLLACLWLGRNALSASPWTLAIGATVWTAALLGGLLSMQGPMRRAIGRIRERTGTTDAEFEPELIRRGLGAPGPVRWETRARVFGLPLVVFSSGSLDAGGYSARSARGWIAIGDLAISPLFAAGGLAIAPIAIGGVTVGLISLSIGGVALGALAVGSLAFGWVALGAVAVAWRGAVGAASIAHDYAIGPAARAIHANTDVAATWFRDQWFVAPSGIFVALIPWLVLLSIVIPLGLLARRAWRMRGH